MSSNTPTSRQLAYAKRLAEQTGTTFVMPKTQIQASREIKRLLALKENMGSPALIEEQTAGQLSLAQEDHRDETYATAPAPGEIQGYGATATWAGGTDDEPAATPKQLAFIRDLAEKAGTEPPEPQTRRQASHEIDQLLRLARATESREPRELARYSLDGHDRVLRSTPGEHGARLTDEPDNGSGEIYVIERELLTERPEELQALIADYLQQAESLQAVPMATSVLGADRAMAGAAL